MSTDAPAKPLPIEEQWPFPNKPPLEHAGFLGGKEACNLVMKGGITSGVVYPATVVHLAQKYRFRAIGGTSAGAIAAVASAAAEYGRELTDPRAGFVGLQQVSNTLAEDGFVANLFQPIPATRPLLQTFLNFLSLQRELKERMPALQQPPWVLRFFLGRQSPPQTAPNMQTTQDVPGWWKWWNIGQRSIEILSTAQGGTIQQTRVMQRRTIGTFLLLLPFLLLTISAIVSCVIFRVGKTPVANSIWLGMFIPALVILITLAWLVRWVFPLGWAIYDVGSMLTGDIPGNFFGMCSGLTITGQQRSTTQAKPSHDAPALTNWLTTIINELAGRAGDANPVTFGDLRTHEIELRMVTTNLSRTQPCMLPFSTNEYLFNEREMRLLFPPAVVDDMVRAASVDPRFTSVDGAAQKCVLIGATPADRYYFLPIGDELPIVVAARMSLSFPILLSAVPLYTLSTECYERIPAEPYATQPPYPSATSQRYALQSSDLQKNWFSDGGICSNFPIHLFDTWYPNIPTFGINLDELPATAFEDDNAQTVRKSALSGAGLSMTDPVWLPSSYPDALPAVTYKEKNDLVAFLWAVIDTALNYRDMLQSRLPSYYDRIVTVRLSEAEGGLNLEMPPANIQKMREKGAIAGSKIEEYFNLDHHRWVRLLLLLRELEEQSILVQQAITIDPSTDSVEQKRIDELIQEQLRASTSNAKNQIATLIQTQLRASTSDQTAFPFARDQDWVDVSAERLAILLYTINVWGASPDGFFQQHDPDTKHIQLRITPEF